VDVRVSAFRARRVIDGSSLRQGGRDGLLESHDGMALRMKLSAHRHQVMDALLSRVEVLETSKELK
jgi:hypothetical protein